MYHCRMVNDIYSGKGSIQQLGALCRGRCPVAVFTDRGIAASGTLERVTDVLTQAGCPFTVFSGIPSEPSYEQAQGIYDRYAEKRFGMILAVGGGSVIDTAKLCSAMDGRASVYDLLSRPELAAHNVYCAVIPTTAGTGAEATPNAIVAVPEKQIKVGIVSEQFIPDAVILDPIMISKLPRKIAASTGVDALCHAVECYTSLKATPLSDLFALQAAVLIFKNIEAACLEDDNGEAREAMLLGAFYAGIAIACSGTTAVHALSYPLGGKYHIPHGVANAMMLVPVMEYNLSACADRLALIYDAVGETELTGEEQKAAWVVARMAQIVGTLPIPTGLGEYGVKMSDLDDLVNAGMSVQRLLKNNRRPVTEEAAREIYRGLLKGGAA